MILSDFAKSMKDERIHQGLTFRELAQRTGISASTLCRIENGKINLKTKTADIIIEALGLDPDLSAMNEDITVDHLHLYFITFAIRREKEFTAHAGYIFAYDEESLSKLLNEQYGEVRIRSVHKIDIQEGTVLCGERWKRWK